MTASLLLGLQGERGRSRRVRPARGIRRPVADHRGLPRSPTLRVRVPGRVRVPLNSRDRGPGQGHRSAPRPQPQEREAGPRRCTERLHPPRWGKHVLTPEGIDRRFYETCVLSELGKALRAGDLWVSGSRRYGDFDEYLLPRPVYEAMKARARYRGRGRSQDVSGASYRRAAHCDGGSRGTGQSGGIRMPSSPTGC